MEVCGDCLLRPPDLDACVAAVSYGYPWAQAIKALKFQEDPGWAATLATLLHRAPAAQVAIAQADEVLCVPLSRQRLRERKRVILVDDVMTTGATLNSIAATLRAAGVEHITAMVIARTERD